MKRALERLVACAVLLGAASCVGERGSRAAGPDKGDSTATQVLVVGTVHDQHGRNPNYTYEDVVRIVDTFDPDVVCVEIRPDDFRRVPYLKEMMLATVWGASKGRETCAFDWYDGTTRRIRRELAETPEYVEKEREFQELIASNPITVPFEERYGDYWSGEMDYRFYNGSEYNRYFEEWYRLSLAVYGDDPLNLYYESRNRRMMDQAWEVIRRFPGRRVALLTGTEHKHYFDRDLGSRDGVQLIRLEDLLPLTTAPLDPSVEAFLLEENDLPYYLEGFPEDTTRYYSGKVTNLIHGPNMDWRPEIIPTRNIEVAGLVLARWRASQAESPRLLLDEGWQHFLAGDCPGAIEHLLPLTGAIERGEVDDLFVRAYAYRNLGWCHDLLGDRDSALEAYSSVRRITAGTRMERSAEPMLRDVESTPFVWDAS